MKYDRFRFPQALQNGSHIAVTGPSGGVVAPLHPRLDLVIQHLRDRGFKVTEGKCLRNEYKHVSAAKRERAADLMRFLTDDSIDAICPPWGGEVLIEILPLLDFDLIQKQKPKWITSYSDISTLTFALTTQTGMATAHTPNLMDLAPSRPDSNDKLTGRVFDILATPHGAKVEQHSSEYFQPSARLDFDKDVGAVFMPTEPSTWKSLKNERSTSFHGRLIGGCLDTISCLTGTPYGDLTHFKRTAGKDGVIIYLENCEGTPPAVVRSLENLKQAGWFEGISGLLIGRSRGPDATNPNHLSYIEALQNVFEESKFPIVYDADIGHCPPQMTLINGAMAEVMYEIGRGRVVQTIG